MSNIHESIFEINLELIKQNINYFKTLFISVNNSSFLKGLGLVHAIAHMVGAEYNTHHGLTNAIILPTVLRYNLPTLEEKVKRMSEAMQYEDSSVATFITNQEKLLDRFNIPKGLKEIGVPEDCVDRIAEKSMVDTAFGTNPIKADLDDVRKLVIESINKAR